MSITKLTSNGLTGSKYDTVSADNYYMEPIATQLVGVGGVSSIIFNNIPQGYKHLQVRLNARGTSANIFITTGFRLNGDTGSNYSNHRLVGTGNAMYSQASINDTQAYFTASSAASGAANCFSASIADFLDYSNVYKFKTVKVLSGAHDGTNDEIQMRSTVWMNTAPITSMTLFLASGNIAQYSIASLYGIKG